jgi:hypothetical protein
MTETNLVRAHYGNTQPIYKGLFLSPEMYKQHKVCVCVRDVLTRLILD